MTEPVPRTPPLVVTGGSGFIGAHILREALADGRAATGHIRSIENAARLRAFGLMDAGTVKLVDGLDLSNDESVRSTIAQAAGGALIHAAARTSVIGGAGAEDLQDTVAEIRLIVAACRASGVRRLVLLGSAASYGPSEAPHSEDEALAPGSPYGLGKALTSLIAHANADDALSVIELRLFNIYGVADIPSRIIPYCIAKARAGTPLVLRNPANQRDFVHVSDVTRIALAAADGALPGGVYNVATGRATLMRDIAQTLASLAGQNAPVTSGDTPEEGDVLHGSPARLAQYGLAPRITLSDGLRLTLAETAQLEADPPLRSRE